MSANEGTVPAEGTAAGVAGAPNGSPNRSQNRGLLRFAVIAATLVVVYALVVILYSQSGRVQSLGEDRDPPTGGVSILLTPQSVNTSAETISMRVQLDASPELESSDTITLANDLTVIVLPVDQSQTIDFPAGSIPSTHSIDALATGEIQNWPFDAYRAGLYVEAFRTVGGVSEPIPTYVFMDGHVPGWSFSAEIVDVPADAVGVTTSTLPEGTPEGTRQGSAEGSPGVGSGSATGSTIPIVSIAAERSWSTLAFGILLLGLMVIIACLVLAVSVSVYRGTRRVEASFMSWMGAMLFATIPLRAFLPGSPPIGSWIDFLIVLWVFVALVSGLVIYVSAWRRWGSPGGSRKTPE